MPLLRAEWLEKWLFPVLLCPDCGSAKEFFMETKEQQRYYLIVKGQKVEVSEEVYRAYVRPIRAEQRAARRRWRCIKRSKKYGWVRCQKDCNECPYAQSGHPALGNDASLEALLISGCDFPSTVDIEGELIEREEQEERAEMIQNAMKQLNERQRFILREHFLNCKTHGEIAQALGIDRTSVSKAIARALETLKKFMEKK